MILGLFIMLGVIVTSLIVIIVFGAIGVRGSQRWFPWL